MPANVSFAFIPARGDPVSRSVELWATRRLPFEPAGELKLMRDELRERLRAFSGHDGRVVHAIYASANRELVDVENVLIYNVGASCLAAAAAQGLRFERGFELPGQPPGLLFEPAHYHRYALARADGDFSGWRRGAVWASWEAVAVPPLGAGTKVHDLWLKLRAAARSHGVPRRAAPFGARIEVVAPRGTSAQPAAFVKPLLDAAICALHAYRGDSLQLTEASARIAALTARTPQLIAELLISDSVAVLGPRRTVSPYREGVKWDPADDLCLAAEILLSQGQDRDWHLSGEVFEITATPAAHEARAAAQVDEPAAAPSTSAPPALGRTGASTSDLSPRAPNGRDHAEKMRPPLEAESGASRLRFPPMTASAPVSWHELRTAEQWEQIPSDGDAVVVVTDITDRAKSGPVYHRPGCSFVHRDHFIRKVVTALAAGKRPNGHYFWAPSTAAAEAGGARACRHPSDPLNR